MASNVQKWVIGCSLGCLALIIVVVGVLVGVSQWMKRPGELLQPARLLGPETTGYGEWTLARGDPGAELFVRQLVNGLQDAGASDAPLAGLAGIGRDRNNEQLKEALPILLAWTQRPGETPEDDRYLLTASLEKVGKRMAMIDWILSAAIGRGRDENARVHSHAGEKIFELKGEEQGHFVFFIRGNDVFVTSDVATATEAVDRLLAPRPPPEAPASRPPTAVERLFAATEAGAPLRVAVGNGRGELARLVERLGGDSASAAWSELVGLALSGRLEADGTLTGTLDLLAPDPARAAQLAQALAADLAQLAGAGSRVQWGTPAVEGDHVRITFRSPELATELSGWVGQRIEKAKERAREAGR